MFFSVGAGMCGPAIDPGLLWSYTTVDIMLLRQRVRQTETCRQTYRGVMPLRSRVAVLPSSFFFLSLSFILCLLSAAASEFHRLQCQLFICVFVFLSASVSFYACVSLLSSTSMSPKSDICHSLYFTTNFTLSHLPSSSLRFRFYIYAYQQV